MEFFRAVVVADDRLTSDAETDHNADDDGVDLHYYAESGQRNIRAVDALEAVLDREVIHADNDDRRAELRKEARNAEGQERKQRLAVEKCVFALELNALEARNICNCEHKVEYLADYRCPRGTCNAPAEAEHEPCVEHNV